MTSGQIGESIYSLVHLYTVLVEPIPQPFLQEYSDSRMGRLDGFVVPDYCATPEAIISNECPSSEWQSLAAFEVITNNSIPFPEDMTYISATLPDYTQLTGCSSIRQFFIGALLDVRPGAIPYARVSTTQQSVIADALTNTAALWDIALINVTSGSTHRSPFLNQRAATQVIKSS